MGSSLLNCACPCPHFTFPRSVNDIAVSSLAVMHGGQFNFKNNTQVLMQIQLILYASSDHAVNSLIKLIHLNHTVVYSMTLPCIHNTVTNTPTVTGILTQKKDD